MKLNLRMTENGRRLVKRNLTQKCMKDLADGNMYRQALVEYAIGLDNLNKISGRDSIWFEAVKSIKNYRSYHNALNAMNEISGIYA